MLSAFLLAMGINTNYKYPLLRTGTPMWGTDTTSVGNWYPLWRTGVDTIDTALLSGVFIAVD